MPSHRKEAALRDWRRFRRWATEGKDVTVGGMSVGCWDICPSFLMKPRRWVAPIALGRLGRLVAFKRRQKDIRGGLCQRDAVFRFGTAFADFVRVGLPP